MIKFTARTVVVDTPFFYLNLVLYNTINDVIPTNNIGIANGNSGIFSGSIVICIGIDQNGSNELE
jgi:hypothetical protein